MFPLNFKNKYFLNTAEGELPEVWSPIAGGISAVDPSFEDETDDTTYYDGEGFGNEEVTGVRISLAFSGHRKYDDVAQNTIADLAFEVGDTRKRTIKWEQPDGVVITGSVTISGIKTTGGDANAKQEFEFTATFNGKPTITPAV